MAHPAHPAAPALQWRGYCVHSKDHASRSSFDPSLTGTSHSYGNPSLPGTSHSYANPSPPGTSRSYANPSLPGTSHSYANPSIPGTSHSCGNPSLPGTSHSPGNQSLLEPCSPTTVQSILRSLIEKTVDESHSFELLEVNRNRLWRQAQSFYKKSIHDPYRLTKDFRVEVVGEEGVDAGALALRNDFFESVLKHLNDKLFQNFDVSQRRTGHWNIRLKLLV